MSFLQIPYWVLPAPVAKDAAEGFGASVCTSRSVAPTAMAGSEDKFHRCSSLIFFGMIGRSSGARLAQ